MSLAQFLDHSLPFMRRYARAVTGDKKVGDTCVESALTELVKLNFDVDFDEASVDKPFLFKLLDQELAKLPGQDSTPDRARRALLLTSMESLSRSEAARILGIDDQGVEDLLAMAEHELLQSLATRLLIIEDEPIIAAHLKKVAESIGHTVVGVAVNAEQAVEIYHDQQPDIILSDIQLAGGSLGTDAIKRMAPPDTIPVIFITAYPEQMLRNKDEGPTYLIVKPFQPDYVRSIISHALIRADKKKAENAISD